MSAPRLALLVALAAGAASAADPPNPALPLVPADAEAYHAVQHLGATADAVAKSRAWRRVWAEPAVQAAWAQYRAMYADAVGQPQWAASLKFLADPANRDLPALATDAVSHEIFAYAGPGWGDLLALLQETFGAARYGPLFQGLAGADPAAQNKARVKLMLHALAEHPDRIRVPDHVVGFRVSDPATVAAHLRRLDGPLADALAGTPLRGRVRRQDIDGDSFLTVRVDGSLVPWNNIDLDPFEDQPGQYDALVKRLKKLQFMVAVGVRKGYLILAVGETVDHLARFGGAGPKLSGAAEFRPLAGLAGRPVTSVGYVSRAFLGAVGTTGEDLSGVGELVKTLIDKAGLPDELRESIAADVTTLTAAAATGVRKPGAVAEFTARTGRGWETFTYDYSDADPAAARPLTLLNHVGGRPLVAAVGRSGTTVAEYRAVAKWVARFANHAEAVVAAKAPNVEDAVKAYRAAFGPILADLSETTATQWLPALADGQEALVIDARWTSRRWHPVLPEADRPLPLPEIGIVLGVSDPAKLEAALGGYRAGVNQLLAKAREMAPPGAVPPFEIPRPRIERTAGRVFAHYPVPDEWGIDPQFRPTGGLSDRVAAVSLSRAHTERLLTATPLAAGTTPLADPGRPLVSAFHADWAGLVGLVRPWVGYGIRVGVPPAQRADAERAADLVGAVLGTFRGYSAATYREAGATVTRSEAVFRDVADEP